MTTNKWTLTDEAIEAVRQFLNHGDSIYSTHEARHHIYSAIGRAVCGDTDEFDEFLLGKVNILVDIEKQLRVALLQRDYWRTVDKWRMAIGDAKREWRVSKKDRDHEAQKVVEELDRLVAERERLIEALKAEGAEP